MGNQAAKLNCLTKNHNQIEGLHCRRLESFKGSRREAQDINDISNVEPSAFEERTEDKRSVSFKYLSLASKRSKHKGCLDSELQHRCEYCAEVTDSTHWIKAKPIVSIEEGFSVFVQNCSPGHFECTQTGIRWVCHTALKLQYHLDDWERLGIIAELYEPIGPLLNITLLEGQVQEIHLPHFLCLGDADSSVVDLVKVLHWQKEGQLSMENCDLTRFHCKLYEPSFSILGSIITKGQGILSLKVHGALLHYCVRTSPLIVHTYLIPEDQSLIRCVKETNVNYSRIFIPKPEKRFQLGAYYQLKTLPVSRIMPQKLRFRYTKIDPNFFKVRIEKAEDKFKMELICVNDGKCKWTDVFHKDEYCKTTAKSHVDVLHSHSAAMIENEAKFIDNHRPALIESVTYVPPIAELMLSQGLIHSEKFSNIIAARTSEDKMREIYKCLQSTGNRGKAQFYQILLLKEPQLIRFLDRSHC